MLDFIQKLLYLILVPAGNRLIAMKPEIAAKYLALNIEQVTSEE